MSRQARRGSRARPWTRRRLLAALPGLAAALALATAGCGPRRRDDELAAILASLLGDPATLAPVGRAYLRQRPGLDRAAVIDELLETLGRGARVAAPEELRGLVVERVHAELAEERLVEVDGWLLAETEAAICAVAALSPPPESS